MQIAVVSESSRISDADVAFAVKACAQQAEELCAAWTIAYVPVAFYARGTSLPATTTHAMVLVDDLDEPGVLGWHDSFAGIAFGKVLVQDVAGTGVTLSHECCELIVDPDCDRWAPMPDGRNVAIEVCDPCEADSYIESVEILGETRGVWVSDYVLPAYFEATGVAPFDRMNRLTAPFAMAPGGYLIVMDAAGDVSNVFAEAGAMPRTFARKLVNPKSRTLRRLRGR